MKKKNGVFHFTLSGDRVCAYVIFYFFNKAHIFAMICARVRLLLVLILFHHFMVVFGFHIFFPVDTCGFVILANTYANGQKRNSLFLKLYCDVCTCECVYVCKAIKAEYKTISSVTKGRSKKKLWSQLYQRWTSDGWLGLAWLVGLLIQTNMLNHSKYLWVYVIIIHIIKWEIGSFGRWTN